MTSCDCIIIYNTENKARVNFSHNNVSILTSSTRLLYSQSQPIVGPAGEDRCRF